jgi:hypothetical protein
MVSRSGYGMLYSKQDIAEVVAASGPVGMEDVDALEGYLKGKYGL